MEEKPEQPSPSENQQKKQPTLCEECKINPPKYKCPGCSLCSCSLPCVNSHKQRTSCTGKRPITSFVPISKFDDNLLLSDYSMLEDVKRVAGSAQRMRVKLCGYQHFGLPFPLKSLRSAAASRKTKLLLLSNGMSKREKNKTYYDKRNKFISWTIEWRFHSTDVVLVDHEVHEDTILSSVIENHLKPGPWNHSLRQFCDQSLDSLKFFIRKYPKGPKSPFRQLNIRAPIRQQLRDMVVLEYPVILVFLPSHSYNFDIINDVNPSKAVIKKPAYNDCPSPQGVTFREEEIEDRESSNPHVSDLSNHAFVKKGVEKEHISHNHVTSTVQFDDIGSRSCIEELVDIPDLDFEFGPGLIDVYPDLVSGTNPNDFLDFEGMVADPKDLDGGEFLMDEELEEGEIAEL